MRRQSRSVPLLAVGLLLHPMHVSAQITGLVHERDSQTVAPVRLERHFVLETDTHARILVPLAESEESKATVLRWPATTTTVWLERASIREATRVNASMHSVESTFVAGRQQARRTRSWIGRHPVLFGTLVGFAGGFAVGYLPGRDAVFEDQDAAFSGLVLGGVGAGAGALVGAIVGAAAK